MVTFSADNGQLKATFDGGDAPNDYTVTIGFTDDAGTATDADITNAVELTAGVAQLGGATAATLRGNGTTTDTVTGFSAPTISLTL